MGNFRGKGFFCFLHRFMCHIFRLGCGESVSMYRKMLCGKLFLHVEKTCNIKKLTIFMCNLLIFHDSKHGFFGFLEGHFSTCRNVFTGV